MRQWNEIHHTYRDVAIEATARGARRDRMGSFQVDVYLPHAFGQPGIIASQLCNILPVIVWRQGKVHRIDLGGASDSIAARIKNTQSLLLLVR